jgi:hypothetical protein
MSSFSGRGSMSSAAAQTPQRPSPTKAGRSPHSAAVVPVSVICPTALAANWNRLLLESIENIMSEDGDAVIDKQKRLNEELLAHLKEIDDLYVKNKRPNGLYDQALQEINEDHLHNLCIGSILLVPSAGVAGKNPTRFMGGLISKVAKIVIQRELSESRQVRDCSYIRRPDDHCYISW